MQTAQNLQLAPWYSRASPKTGTLIGTGIMGSCSPSNSSMRSAARVVDRVPNMLMLPTLLPYLPSFSAAMSASWALITTADASVELAEQSMPEDDGPPFSHTVSGCPSSRTRGADAQAPIKCLGSRCASSWSHSRKTPIGLSLHNARSLELSLAGEAR